MPLEDAYSEDFARLWLAYPKWKKNRNNKGKAWKAFKTAKRVLKFAPEDIAELLNHIELRKKTDAKWQEGNQYGYMAFEVFMNQRRWLDEYDTVADKKEQEQSRSTWNPDPVWKQLGFASEADHERALDAEAPRIKDMLEGTLKDLRSQPRMH